MFGKFGSAFAMLFVLTTLVAAQSGLVGTGWYTTAVIQNVSTTNGSLTLEAFPLTGVSTGGGTASTPLDAGKAVTFRPDNPGTAGTVGIPGIASGSFQGSMVLSSDVEVVSVAFLNNAPLATMGTAGGKASGAYNGVPQGSTTLTYPSVKSGFNGSVTSFFIQAAGSAATVNVSVLANDGVTYTKNNISIEANKSYVLLTSNLLNGTTPMPTGCTGGATGSSCAGAMTITSTAPVAGTVVEYPSAGSPGVVAMSTNMFAAAAAGVKLSCPTIKQQFPSSSSASTGIAIQNVSASAQDITLSIVERPSGTVYTHVFPAVPAGGSVVASRFLNTLGGMPANRVGAATITSAGNVIAIASEANDPSAAAQQALYACSSASTSTSKLAMPIVKFEFPSKTNALAGNTGVNVQNVGTASTTVTGAFTCRNTAGVFTNYTVAKTAAAGASIAFGPFQDMATIPTGSLCSVVFTATQPLVGIGNESVTGTTATHRDANTYEGFSLVP